MTGASERPSRSSPETRKAESYRFRETHRDQRDTRSGVGKAERALVAAEMALLVAAQRDARRKVLAAIDAAFAARHGDRRAAIQARYAGLRAALEPGDNAARTAALMRLVADEAAELAVVALEMAAERARAKRMAVVAQLMQDRSARRQLRRSRRHRAVVRAVGRKRGAPKAAAGRPPVFRIRRP